MHFHASELAVAAASLYFVGFGTAFVFKPDLVDRFGLKSFNPAGRVEVRCYYGAVSWGISAFLIYLLSQHLSVEALTGVLFLASAVVTVRIIGTVVDRAWKEAYTRLAIPTEAAFVIALSIVRFVHL